MTHTACLKAFSHVVEGIILLQQDNVICQALFDSAMGSTDNLCIIKAQSLQFPFTPFSLPMA
jgi:hypothetical protein